MLKHTKFTTWSTTPYLCNYRQQRLTSYADTVQTRIRLSVYPANKVCPSADHASESTVTPWPLGFSARSSSTVFLLSRSQILMTEPAAAQSQYRLGLNVSASIMSPPSRVYKCLPSFKSHNIALPSLPPDAHNEPSGDTVTVLRYPLWPKWSYWSLQLVRFQTLTTRSQPQETMIGLAVDGENRTHDTQLVWPSSVIEYLHSPRVFQSLMVLSRDPDTIWRLSAENATLKTSPVCP